MCSDDEREKRDDPESNSGNRAASKFAVNDGLGAKNGEQDKRDSANVPSESHVRGTHHERVTRSIAIGALGIAILTSGWSFWSAYNSSSSADSARDSAQTAKQAFVMSQRPYLGLQTKEWDPSNPLSPSENPQGGKVDRIIIEGKNFGNTPAIVVQRCMKIKEGIFENLLVDKYSCDDLSDQTLMEIMPQNTATTDITESFLSFIRGGKHSPSSDSVAIYATYIYKSYFGGVYKKNFCEVLQINGEQVINNGDCRSFNESVVIKDQGSHG